MLQYAIANVLPRDEGHGVYEQQKDLLKSALHKCCDAIAEMLDAEVRISYAALAARAEVSVDTVRALEIKHVGFANVIRRAIRFSHVKTRVRKGVEIRNRLRGRSNPSKPEKQKRVSPIPWYTMALLELRKMYGTEAIPQAHLARKVGRSQTSVSKFLKTHPELIAAYNIRSFR